MIIPLTTAGRAVCIVYAAVGIPLCLVVLADLGKLLAIGISKMTYKLWFKNTGNHLGNFLSFVYLSKQSKVSPNIENGITKLQN